MEVELELVVRPHPCSCIVSYDLTKNKTITRIIYTSQLVTQNVGVPPFLVLFLLNAFDLLLIPQKDTGWK